MEYDIAEILECRDLQKFLKIMQDYFEERIGSRRFLRLTATPSNLGEVDANLGDSELRNELENPPGRDTGWVAKPLPPLRRNSLGFENERIDFHHLKFIRNGHLEFWTEIDEHFCWMQNPEQMKNRPRLYPYPVVEYPVSFSRMYRNVCDRVGVSGSIVFQMQYLNVQGIVLYPYQPESIGFQFPMQPVKPLQRSRLLFPKKTVQAGFDPDLTALEVIKDLYFEFGYGIEHIPFFKNGHFTL